MPSRDAVPAPFTDRHSKPRIASEKGLENYLKLSIIATLDEYLYITVACMIDVGAVRKRLSSPTSSGPTALISLGY